MIAEHAEATRIGIRYLQAGANKAALQELCNKKDEKYQTALAEFNKGQRPFYPIRVGPHRSLPNQLTMSSRLSRPSPRPPSKRVAQL